LGLESYLAGFLPVLWYIVWIPTALTPYLFERARSHGVAAAVTLCAGTVTGVFASARGTPAITPSELAAVATAVATSLLLALILKGRMVREEHLRGELSQRLQTRNTMLSTLAHEIRTPLTVLRTSSALILEEHPGTLTKDQRRLMRQIDSGVARLIHFSDNLIASIKVDQGWFSLDLHPVDLRKIIKGVVEHVQPLLAQRRQELKLKFPSLLSRVPGDRQWLEQVMVNLIHNAAKYAEPEGLIDVAVRENEQWVVVSIGDNGAGIGGDERFQVFSEFYQGDHWGAAQLNGSGLGLAIVKRVVERHGGEVYVGSVEGIGTIISFTLPKEKAPHA
jgi:signal transduction histidine kinase